MSGMHALRYNPNEFMQRTTNNLSTNTNLQENNNLNFQAKEFDLFDEKNFATQSVSDPYSFKNTMKSIRQDEL